jgi:signal transduction histidine kinase
MGLRVRVAVAFVLVTLGAVLVVEAVLIGIVAPPVIGAQVSERDQINQARANAAALAAKMSDGSQPGIPATGAPCTASGRAGPVLLLVTPGGRILQSSYPACYPIGAAAPVPPGDPGEGGGKTADGAIVWATAPLGANHIYAQEPVRSNGYTLGNVSPLITPGLVVLAVAVPVGLLFGYISMRRPVRQLRRLATTTQALANGELGRRIPVRGKDELAQLEDSVNRMAEQLFLAINAERELAAAHARTLERARLARDLHDSISQELFSLRLLASGIHRALPGDSPLREQVESMSGLADSASRQMRAMLLQLRPPELAETGLCAALRRLAQNYHDRLGVSISTEIEEVTFTEEEEQALMRIAQEAVANAVRHGNAPAISVALRQRTLTIRDDGTGFDPGAATAGLGLTLIRERAGDIGATLEISSSPGAGATITAHLP